MKVSRTIRDIDAAYKAGYQALEVALGRPPTVKDRGWWDLSEAYKAAVRELGPAREVVDESGTVTPEQWEALSRPGAIESGVPDQTTGEGTSAALRLSQTATVTVGSASDSGRGPNGGILATCISCEREWERPARRGRPAAQCGECRP